MSACYCVALCCYVTMLGKCAARVLLRTAFVHSPQVAPSVFLCTQVELNATFYGWFDESTYDAWRERCVKESQPSAMQHCQTMQNCRLQGA